MIKNLFTLAIVFALVFIGMVLFASHYYDDGIEVVLDETFDDPDCAVNEICPQYMNVRITRYSNPQILKQHVSVVTINGREVVEVEYEEFDATEGLRAASKLTEINGLLALIHKQDHGKSRGTELYANYQIDEFTFLSVRPVLGSELELGVLESVSRLGDQERELDRDEVLYTNEEFGFELVHPSNLELIAGNGI